MHGWPTKSHNMSPSKKVQLPQQQLTLYEREFSVESLPFLAEHRVYGELVSPGACRIAMALSAGAAQAGWQLAASARPPLSTKRKSGRSCLS